MGGIVIIGGGVIGSSIAYQLGRAGAAGDVTVIEDAYLLCDGVEIASIGRMRDLKPLDEPEAVVLKAIRTRRNLQTS